MLVLLDLEWIETPSERKCITQIAAIRIDDRWRIQRRFEVVLCPAELSQYDTMHMAFSGYPIETFQKGESEEKAIKRLASWLQNDDMICVWSYPAKKLLEQIWQDTFQKPIPYLLFHVNNKVYQMVQDTNDDAQYTFYSLAEDLGVLDDLPQHCSKNDVVVMKRLFEKMGISQDQLRKIFTHGKFNSLIQRNKVIMETALYNYVYTPKSGVFHTKTCPYILNAKTIVGSVYYKTAMKKKASMQNLQSAAGW